MLPIPPDPPPTATQAAAGQPVEPTGLRLIVWYKLGKAVVELVGGAALFSLSATGLLERWLGTVAAVRHQAVEGWAIALIRLIEAETTTRHAEILAGVLLLDSLLSAFEAWSLHRRYVWGSWLVIIATGSLLPIEIYELVQHVRVGRALLFVVNAAIFAYLVLSHRKQQAAARRAAATTPVAIR